MDVWRITVAALRRWYIVLPLLALSAVAAYTAGQGIQPEYQSSGSAMVIPGQAASPVPNPYGGTDDANTVIGIVLNSPETRSQMVAAGLSASFEVSAMTRSSIMSFSVRADTPEVALQTGAMIFDLAAAELQERQERAGIPVDAQYSLDILQQPALSAVVTEGKLRNMAIVGVLGGGLSLVVGVLFDDIVGLFRRRKKRSKKHAEHDARPTNDPHDPPGEATVDDDSSGSAEAGDTPSSAEGSRADPVEDADPEPTTPPHSDEQLRTDNQTDRLTQDPVLVSRGSR